MKHQKLKCSTARYRVPRDVSGRNSTPTTKAQTDFYCRWRRYMAACAVRVSLDEGSRRLDEGAAGSPAYLRLRWYIETHPELVPILFFGKPMDTPACKSDGNESEARR